MKLFYTRWQSSLGIAPGWHARRRQDWLRVLSMVACALLLVGCASPRAFMAARAPPGPSSCAVPVPPRDLLVGVAMSGGGSRAALFGAAGLEALGRLPTLGGKSVLEHVSYVSSVSGGSIAASYYTLKKPPRYVSMLDPEGNLMPAYENFFSGYRNAMSQKIGPAIFRRQLSRFRWFNPALGAESMSEILREEVLGNSTFRDLAQREASGDSPGLIVNTTLYNNGRRFAMTVHPSDTFHYDFFQDLQRSLTSQGRPSQIPPILLERWNTLLPMTPQEINMNTCSVPLVAAVTASASFPPLIGPITFQVAGDSTFWHAGDGGLYENQGAESVLFLFLKQLQQKRARRALILAFDSSFPFAVGDIELARRAQPFSLFSFDFSRIPSIMEERATTFRALFFRTLQLLGVFPGEQTMQVIILRHTDAKWQTDLSDLPIACRNENPALQTPLDVRLRLAKIPTRLQIMSECDSQLLTVSAAKVVAQNQQEIRQFIDAQASAASK